MKFYRGLMLQMFLIMFAFSTPIGSVNILAQSQHQRINEVSPDLSNGLIDQWTFDEETGPSILDSSDNSSLGTLYGPTRTEGPMGQALEFDGVDDYAEILDDGAAPSHLNSVGDGAISIWFMLNELPPTNGTSPLFHYGGFNPCNGAGDAANQGFVIEVGHGRLGSHRIYFTAFADGCEYPSFCVDSRDRLVTNQWYHFTAVIEQNYNTLYLNGEELTDRHYNFGSERSSEFFADAVVDETIWLGKGYWNEEFQYLNGAIDEIRVYDRPLTSNEVLDLYNMADLDYRSYSTLFDTTFEWPTDPEYEEYEPVKTNSDRLNFNYLSIILGMFITLISLKLIKMKKKFQLN